MRISLSDMKKALTTVVIILICLYTLGNKHRYSNISASHSIDSSDYYIYHIDSINSIYIICAKSRGYNYKILTSRKGECCDNKIQVGNTYRLTIEGIFHKFIPRDGVNPAAGLLADSATYLEFEEGYVKDFYRTNDLKGLCIKNNKIK
jgi:hypothetical protein